MDRKPRHLRAIESIDRGLAEAEQITIEDGIRHAIAEGRMSQEDGEACITSYRHARIGLLGLKAVPDPEPGPGWSNGVNRLKDPVEQGWEPDPGAA